MNIEDTIFDTYLPVNTLAMLGRLVELISEHDTNSLTTDSCREDVRIQKLMWLICNQFYGIEPNFQLIWEEFYSVERGKQ